MHLDKKYRRLNRAKYFRQIHQKNTSLMTPSINLRAYPRQNIIKNYEKIDEFKVDRINNQSSVEKHWHARTFNINLPITIANDDSQRHHFWEASPILPIGMMLILSTLVFLLIMFRRWPNIVVIVVAASLSSIAIYLFLLSVKQSQFVYV
ncbi:uncharacterized protein LOC113383033 [Ctenocephalides felis]|uniref:uncharacterized protein LOC113383033 n=1 Tax=Ctenocephalides felis TaxID=7515 RepID=UPI000E6E504A|nr:uncharacterized protein LOC113383033 [Ctenocephalides felis]